MPEEENTIGATHEFHSDEYVRQWAECFEVTKERRECFEHIGDLLEPELNDASAILELGAGPGYLASYLLNRFETVRYHCLDYSEAMLNLAKGNLKEYGSRVTYQQIDLTSSSWENEIKGAYSAIVSTWALHDLGSKEAIRAVYQAVQKLLADKGLILNADFIKPQGLDFDFEEGRFSISEHLVYLKNAGFSEVECTKEFEIDLENPASHNNYACLKGRHRE